MIEKSILLRCSADEAFQLFTGRITEWWPPTHRPTKDPESTLHLEQTGRFWERARDGREMELGRVLVWEPPHRLELAFYLGTNPAQPTAVTITFTTENDGARVTTRVTIHHRPTPESADLWNQRAPVFERSWDAVLQALPK
jgi:uncharacterized protein YndB with AHSA1/START domain